MTSFLNYSISLYEKLKLSISIFILSILYKTIKKLIYIRNISYLFLRYKINMGVKQLKKLLTKYAPSSITLRDIEYYKGKKFAIDANLFILSNTVGSIFIREFSLI